MTCIIGFIDKTNGMTYMGCDSCISTGSTKAIMNEGKKKVFKLKDVNNAILGFSGDVRDMNILEYATGLIDKRDEPDIDEEYVVTKFVPNLINIIEKNDRCRTSNGQKEMESYFLLAYKEKMWRISSDYSVTSFSDDYDAIGSGTYHALGSMATTEGLGMTPVRRIHKALQVASKFVPSVAPPFHIINTKNDVITSFEC